MIPPKGGGDCNSKGKPEPTEGAYCKGEANDCPRISCGVGGIKLNDSESLTSKEAKGQTGAFHKPPLQRNSLASFPLAVVGVLKFKKSSKLN